MAQKVLNLEKDKLMLGGKNFEVFLHQPKDKRREGGATEAKFTNLFVQGFPAGTDDAKLSAMFATHGEI